jgi:hypothetical protein
MLGYGSILGGFDGGAGAGLGALCAVVAMLSVYGERSREASDLEHDSEEPADEEALQVAHAVAVVHAPLAV